jgi:Cytochrome P450
LRDQEEMLNVYFDLLITKLKQQITGPTKGKVNMVRWYNYTTFDIVGDLAFGEPFYALEGGEYHPWIARVIKYVKYGHWLRVGKRYPLFQRLLETIVSLFPNLRDAHATHFKYTRDTVGRRLDTDTERKDFIYYVRFSYAYPSPTNSR